MGAIKRLKPGFSDKSLAGEIQESQKIYTERSFGFYPRPHLKIRILIVIPYSVQEAVREKTRRKNVGPEHKNTASFFIGSQAHQERVRENKALTRFLPNLISSKAFTHHYGRVRVIDVNDANK